MLETPIVMQEQETFSLGWACQKERRGGTASLCYIPSLRKRWINDA